MGLLDFLSGDQNAPDWEDVQRAKRRILLENRMRANPDFPFYDEMDERFLAIEYRQALRNIKLFIASSAFDHSDLHFKLLNPEPSFVPDKEIKAIVKGGCPQCGFTYKFDGKHCDHCGFSNEATKSEKTDQMTKDEQKQ